MMCPHCGMENALERDVECWHCGKVLDREKCPRCGGSGFCEAMTTSAENQAREKYPCPLCQTPS